MIVIETSDRGIAGKINREWRAQHMGVLAKMTGKDNSPQLPAAPQLPARLSHRAAAVRDEVERLESELDDIRRWGEEQASQRKVAEGLLDDARRENVHLLNERDDWQRKFLILNSCLDSAAAVLARCLVLKQPEKAAPPAEVEQHALAPHDPSL